MTLIPPVDTTLPDLKMKSKRLFLGPLTLVCPRQKFSFYPSSDDASKRSDHRSYASAPESHGWCFDAGYSADRFASFTLIIQRREYTKIGHPNNSAKGTEPIYSLVLVSRTG